MGPFVEGWTEADVEAALVRGDPLELLYVPVVVSLSPPDCAWAEAICVRLASHPHFNVRGNAMLGFGHLARVNGRLDESVVKPILQAALDDEHDYVRGQANAATDDVEFFLGWKVRLSNPKE